MAHRWHRPSSFDGLMIKMGGPVYTGTPRALRLALKQLRHVKDFDIGSPAPGVVRVTICARWYVVVGLGLWHRQIARHALRILRDNAAAGLQHEVAFVSHMGLPPAPPRQQRGRLDRARRGEIAKVPWWW